MTLFRKILEARGLDDPEVQRAFLSPDYDESRHDPFLLPDMHRAVDRLKQAHKSREKIVVYGDYDIDGLSATALLLDALNSFGFEGVESFIPSRFKEGYGMTRSAVDKVADMGAELILTVDCGSLSHKEVEYAKRQNIDVIVTDHHDVADEQPSAIAVINPKRADSKYPFGDLSGVGVAFKLVQALQTELDGLPDGHEKWLLDLVALGTVCDVVSLTNENRNNVFWGIEVLKKQRRVGLRALTEVSRVAPDKLNARSLGFSLGPRINASGRLKTAKNSLELLMAEEGLEALNLAEELEELNQQRRQIQSETFKEACLQAKDYAKDDVLVISSPGWNKGVIGIVASKILEKFKKPTFIFSEGEVEATASARSFGDFSAVEAVKAANKVVLKGGGHKAAAGATVKTSQIGEFRQLVNDFYKSLKLEDQTSLLLPKADVIISDFSEINEKLIENIQRMEPFGVDNPEPILQIEQATVVGARRLGDEGQHVKLALKDRADKVLQMLAFSAPESFFCELGDEVTAWFQPTLNEWNGYRTVEGRLLNIEKI